MNTALESVLNALPKQSNFITKDNIAQYITANSPASVPVGSVIAHSSNTIPNNYMLCNGSSFDQNQYTSLYNVLGSNTVPDLRGMFIRGLDTTGVIDNSPGRTLLSFEEGSRLTGEWSSDMCSFQSVQVSYSSRQAGMQALGWDISTNQGESFQVTHGAGDGESASYGSGEILGISRPKNVAFNYIVRAA